MLVATQWAQLSGSVSPVALGAVAVATNLLLVAHRHGPEPLDCVLLGALSPRPAAGTAD